MDITITISDKAMEVLNSWLGEGGIEDWLNNSVTNKIRRRLNATVLEMTDRNPKKLTRAEKFALLDGLTLPTRAERDGTPDG